MRRRAPVGGLTALLAIAAAGLAGCPTIGDTLPIVPLGDGHAPDTPDAGPDRGRPLDAGPDRAVEPGPDASADAAPDATVSDAEPADCAPGAPLAPCVICGDDGQPAMPDDDRTCLAPDCDRLSVYERFDEGDEVVCYADHRYPETGRCLDLGICHDDPAAWCTGVDTVEEARVADTPCLRMLGCDGPLPPLVEKAPEGTRCNDIGICDGVGGCTANPACNGFVLPGESFFCEARDGAEEYCQFYLQAPMAIDCATFCGQHGWRCDGAWNSMMGECVHDPMPAACGDAFGSFVCRCVP